MKINNPADGSIKKELHNLLGRQLYEKYSDIMPLLALCQYRLRTYKSYGTFRLMYSTEETTAFLNIYRGCIYPFAYIRNLFSKPGTGRKIMLSATVLKNNRYKSLVENLGEYSIVRTNTVTDIPVYSTGQSIQEYIKSVIGGGKKVLSTGTVTGKKLKKAVNRWLEYILYLSGNDTVQTAEYEKADKLLAALKTEFAERLQKIKPEIKKSGIDVYITVNRYNIRDLLIIRACRELGIKTKQLEHHASRFMHNILELEETYRFCFVDDICCWSDSERDFHKNIYRYECFNGKDLPDIYSVGNPEISYENALKAVADYPTDNRLTFMVSGILNRTDDNAVKKQLEHREKIFAELKRLSHRTGVKILVRYPPGLDMNFRKAEEEKLKQMGFEISPSDRNSLLSDICASRVVIGTISSVLGLAALMGKPVYQIAEDGRQYYITDKNIFTVKRQDIRDIDVDRHRWQLSEKDFMDHERLTAK